uniref:Uncharacterized protein n=1 Tax=Pseudictyota dubia TaxID=2749911 RepID=A0A7R9WDH2_9STRA|mmetsp:Transcript_45700/g.84820  ORF Transcript_45700/g.84820 Transcript_45700/m.84820 type:complete len:1091 (+) Transcript_45700:677-3949(+)
MTMKLVKPFARRIKGSKAGRKRPLPSSGDGKGKAKAGGGGALNGSGGGGSVVTALTATTAESAAVAAAAAAAAAAASTQARRRRPVAKEEEGDGDVDEGGSVGAVVSVAGGIGPAHLAKADGGKREEEEREDPDRPKSVVSRRRRRSRKAPPAAKDQGQGQEEGRSQGQEGRHLLPSSASASDAGPGDGSSQPPPSPAAAPTSPTSSTESPVHFSRDAVLPGPQTLEVHGEEAVPLVYDFWESYVLPHRRSSFANRSYHAADRDGVTIASVVYGEGRKAKKQASKASVTSFATTVRVSNATADASGRRREAFLMDLNGDGKGWAGGAGDSGKKSIGLLINDSGGWEGSQRSSSGNVSGPERPSLSDPYPYWMWPTSRSALFSNPWTAEEEEYWGKTGGIGVRAVLGMSSSSSSYASGSSAGSSRGRRRHNKHKRNSSHGSFSSTSTASTKSRGKMDSHFGGDAMSAPTDDESALFANPHPLQRPQQQQRPKHRRQPPHKQPPRKQQPQAQAQAAEAQAPPGSHHRQASAALLAQRRMMERRRAQRKQRAAKQRPAPPPGAAMAGHPGVGGRRGGPGAGYATPASSVRDLLWNIPENRGAEEEGDDGGKGKNVMIPASALGRSSTPVSRLIASVIQQEQELDGTLNTPPLEGLSSNEEHTKEGESKSSVTESEEPLEVVKDPRNRPDADQPNDPGEHAAPPPAPHVQQVPAVQPHHHRHQQQMHQMHIPVELQMQPQQMPVEVAMQQLEMERQMHMQMQLMLGEGGLGGAPQVPHLAGAPPSGYAVDAPLGPHAHHNGHHQDAEGEAAAAAEGEDEPPRNMIDPAVFRAVLRSKLAASTGVFDWNAGPSSRRVLMEEVVVPDDATEVSGDVTLPVCLMDEEDWENERRRRGFPGQIDVGGGEAGTMARTADGSGRISALTGVGNGDHNGGGGGDEVSALAEPPAGPVAPLPQAQPGGWSNPMMTSTTALQAFGRGESRWEVRGTGNASSTMPPHDIRDGPGDGGVGKMGTVEAEIVVGSQREVGVAEDLGAAAVVVGEVREEKAQEEEEDSPADAADAEAEATESTAAKNPAVVERSPSADEKEEKEEAAT